MIDDARTPAWTRGRPRSAPITREDVLAPFLKALNVPIYEGRCQQAAGYYVTKREIVRIKRKSDWKSLRMKSPTCSTTESRNTAAWKTDPALDAELRGVSYDHKSTAEGWRKRCACTSPSRNWRREGATVQRLDGSVREAQRVRPRHTSGARRDDVMVRTGSH